MKLLLLKSFLQSVCFVLLAYTFCSCQKTSVDAEKPTKDNIFTADDFKRVQADVALTVSNLRSTKLKLGLTGRGNRSRVNDNNCHSELAQVYGSSCFVGTYSEFLIDHDGSVYYSPVHTALSNDMDVVIANAFQNTSSPSNSNFIAEMELSTNMQPTLDALGAEQAALATQLESDDSKTDEQADGIMLSKVAEQEQRILNDPSLNYNDKEYILTTLEMERQGKDVYTAQILDNIQARTTNSITDDFNNARTKKRSLFGKIWRGLAFVAITLATAGKGAVVIAAAAYKIAGKAALMTAALKKSYFAMGVAAAWIPTGQRLVEGQKWNYDPWGSGSFEDWVKFGSGIIGVATNPLFGWKIV